MIVAPIVLRRMARRNRAPAWPNVARSSYNGSGEARPPPHRFTKNDGPHAYAAAFRKGRSWAKSPSENNRDAISAPPGRDQDRIQPRPAARRLGDSDATCRRRLKTD